MNNQTTAPSCSYCGTISSPGESFCRNCGKPLVRPASDRSQYATAPLSQHPQPVSTDTPVPQPVSPMRSGAAPINVGRKRRSRFLLGCLIFIALSVIVLGAGGVYVWRRAAYTSPVRTIPAIPAQAVVALTEFPVDDYAEGRAIPTSVEAEVLGKTTILKADHASATRLPPGITRTLLSEGATSLTSATYEQTTAPANSVYISVLTLASKQQTFITSLSEAVVTETNGEKANARVQSDTGFVYAGSKITSSRGNVYLLSKLGADILILIFSAEPSNSILVDRLAQEVGNAQGLFDYPEVKESLWTLPPSVPAGLTLIEIKTLSRGQIENSIISGSEDKDAQRIVSKMRAFIPHRLTSARYLDSNRKEWMALSFEYESTFQAWRNWLLARVALGLAGASRTNVRSVVGLYMMEENITLLVFHKGHYIVILLGPESGTLERMGDLGNLFQI